MDIEGLIAAIIAREGGYVADPADRGGATCWGITERVARQQGYAGPMRDLPKAEATAIYRRLYWWRPKLDRVAARAPVLASETVLTVSLLSRPVTEKSADGVVWSNVNVWPYVFVWFAAVIVRAAVFTVREPLT